MQVRSRLEFIYRSQKKTASEIKKAQRHGDSALLAGLYDTRAWLYKEERLFLQQLRAYAGEFGLSPRGRVGLVVGRDKDDNDADLLS